MHNILTEAKREPHPKQVQRFPPQAAPLVTAPQESRCNVANNGAYKPTLGPFPFARKKNHRECSIRQVTSIL